MKLYRNLFVLTILFVSFQICYGQKPKAEQVDEFGVLGCEDILARIDSFYFALEKELNSTGYAIIYAKKDSKLARGYEKIINGQIYAARHNSSRLIVKHAEQEDDFRVVFWKIPAGTDLPIFTEQKSFYVLPLSTKASDLQRAFMIIVRV